MLRKTGKKTRAWETARKQLKVIYYDRGILSCELRFPGCLHRFLLSFAHRYKRADPRTEHTFQQTVLACQRCHDTIEWDKQLTEEVFTRLRPSP